MEVRVVDRLRAIWLAMMGNRMYSWKRLILPLGRDPAAVEHLFVCLEYDFI